MNFHSSAFSLYSVIIIHFPFTSFINPMVLCFTFIQSLKRDLNNRKKILYTYPCSHYFLLFVIPMYISIFPSGIFFFFPLEYCIHLLQCVFVNSFSFCMSEKVFIFPSLFLKNIFWMQNSSLIFLLSILFSCTMFDEKSDFIFTFGLLI